MLQKMQQCNNIPWAAIKVLNIFKIDKNILQQKGVVNRTLTIK